MLERDTPRRARWLRALLALTFLLDAGASAGQAGNLPAEEVRVSVLGRFDSGLVSAVNEAVREASRKLARPECQKVFGDFQDRAGRSLQENLDAKKETGSGYLRWLVFYNGLGEPLCARHGVYAATSPGDRFIRLCGDFKKIAAGDLGLASALIIHEELHSLGLAENPPSTFEITQKVVGRCGR